KLSIGVEMFNDFGRLRDLSGYDNQDHQFGPVIKGSFTDKVYFQAGYRAGISQNGTDHLAKFFIGMHY
ncbi:MAG: hypothetical protein MRY32_02280, partial [Rickettsiales bacterium]|nr:hypothetical protein [Rickettsiales bacterium]